MEDVETSRNAQDALGPGRLLGRYELLFPMAAGGMATVWVARFLGARGFQKLVAIKTILPKLAEDEQFEQMFLDEASFASQIHHPHVVEIIDFAEENGILYLVMELVDGVPLNVLIKAARRVGGIPLPISVRIALQACAGLHAAHELRGGDGELVGLVHRDVTPQNILVTYNGTAKVVDFGVAKATSLVEDTTVAGQIKGHVAYMAPEQIKGTLIDRRVDVFALGIVLYALTTGKHPFRRESEAATMYNICCPIPATPPSKVLQDYPPELEQVLLKSLAKDPEERFASAAELQRALDSLPAAMRATTDDDVGNFVGSLLGERRQEQRNVIMQALGNAERCANEQRQAQTELQPTLELAQTNEGITRGDAFQGADDSSKWHFFIAHSSADEDAARQLYEYLAEGFRVFLACNDLLPGDKWATRISVEQRASQVTLVLVSANTDDAYYEQEEVAAAIALARDSRKNHRVVPVLLARLELPYGLRGLHAVRAYQTGLEATAKKLARLFPDLNARYAAYPQELVEELEWLTRERERESTGTTPAGRFELQSRIDHICRQLRRAPAPREGDCVLGARLVRAIGKGNFGTVWQAIDQSTGESRAIKIFDSDRLSIKLTVYHFRRGVRALEHLQKVREGTSTICGFYCADRARLAFSMQYVGGGDLTNIRARSWRLEKKLSVFLRVAEAVHVAHENGVIHRDIKPANIVLTEDAIPVLTDFDIADLLFATQQSAQAAGTICFAAPEQFSGEESHEPSVDVYSLGRLLHFLLIERNPPILIAARPSLPDLCDAPSALVEVIRNATAYNPEDRYSCAASLIEATTQACGQISSGPLGECQKICVS